MALLWNANDLENFVQVALQLLANCSWQENFFLSKCMYVSRDFDFEDDIVIKVGNAADLETHCKNLRYFS